MNGKRWLSLVMLTVFLVACASGQGNQAPLTWADKSDSGSGNSGGGDTGPDAPSDTGNRSTEPSEKVTVEHAVLEELMKVMNREQMIFADLVEIDASLVPFQIAVVPVADPAYVEKKVTSSRQRKTQGFSLRSRIAKPFLERDFPKVRMGDGIDVMGTREVRVTLYLKVTRERPMFLRIRGRGNAVYRDLKSGRRLEQDEIILYAEVVRKGDGTHMVRTRMP